MSIGKVFRDPVHDLIAVPSEDQFILDLLCTPEMQRLRRIRQLGVSLLTYQGAEHSRFTHSLGVYHCVSRLLNALKQNHRDDKALLTLIGEIEKPVKAAGLLHDIGHGPFSHVFERVSNTSHEALTQRIILDPYSRVYQALQRAQINPDDVAEIVRKSYRHSLAVDIISSELDADRMDYLLRDALMCGVTYGRFDIEWMLHVMFAAEVEVGGEHIMKLTADARKGVRAIEQYVMARIYMYEQVYFHKTTRAFEGLLINILNCAKELYREQGWVPPGTTDLLAQILRDEETVNTLELLGLDDFVVLTNLQHWARLSTDDPAQRELVILAGKLVHRERPFASVDITNYQEEITEMRIELTRERSDLRYRWFRDVPGSTYYKGVLYKLEKAKNPEDEANTTIYVLTKNGPERIEARSAILLGLSGQQVQRKIFYYDREMWQDFKPMFEKYSIMSTGGIQ